MNVVKTVTNTLNGRKRALGWAAVFVYAGLVATGIVQYNDVVAGVIFAWTGVGYIHAAYKGE